MFSTKHALVSILLVVLVSGCATTIDPSKWSAKQFYDEAQSALEDGNYETAIKHFEDLEIRHPFSPYTRQAQLEIAYAYYKFNEPDSAISAADRYIKLFPRSKNIDYAYYIKGLVSFDRGLGTLDLIFGLDSTKRSPKTTLESFHYLEELINRFPDSQYAPEAKQRMIHLRNHLANYELHTADYYMRRGAYLSASNRAKYILEIYPQTPAIPEALVIMIKAYRQLEAHDLADDAMKILKLNYPDLPAISELEQTNS